MSYLMLVYEKQQGVFLFALLQQEYPNTLGMGQEVTMGQPVKLWCQTVLMPSRTVSAHKRAKTRESQKNAQSLSPSRI